jgi:hypothetical protein
MSNQKKKGSSNTDDEAAALNNFADAAVESLNPDAHKDLEAFEEYAHSLRCHVKNSQPDFRSRFIQGYETLLREIKDHPTEKD